MRHDNVRDFNAGLLSRVLHDVEKEPKLTPLRTEVRPTNMGNTTDEARADIRARGFWRNGQSAYFDVRVTNPLSASAINKPLSRVYDTHEKEKKREYNHRIMAFENGTFTPLVYSVFGSMGPECKVFTKHLCTKLAEKQNERYEDVTNWVRCKLSFLCLKACLMCLRGTRSCNKSEYISEDFGNDICEANMAMGKF